MAVIVGSLGHFDEKPEKFSDYADRFEAYVAANDIDDDKKVNVFLFFLAVIGPDAYKLLKNLCDPDNPNTKTFIRLTQHLQGHYEPALIVIAEDTSSGQRHKDRARVYQNSSLD